MTALPPYDAVVLAGGAATRLGGVDKPALPVGGRALLDRVLRAVDSAERRIVVGPQRATEVPVTWCREEPPGGGPAAGVAAALPLVRAPWVALLAGDLPFVRGGDLVALRAGALGHDGAVLVDDAGARQWLLGVWSREAIRRCTWAAGGSMRRQLGGLDVVELRAPDRADAPWLDCDTTDDLQRARGLV